MSFLLDLAYLAGIAGLVLGTRWLTSMSSPLKDWQATQRLAVWCTKNVQRMANRARVALLQWVGYTDLKWLLLRRKWRKQAALE